VEGAHLLEMEIRKHNAAWKQKQRVRPVLSGGHAWGQGHPCHSRWLPVQTGAACHCHTIDLQQPVRMWRQQHMQHVPTSVVLHTAQQLTLHQALRHFFCRSVVGRRHHFWYAAYTCANVFAEGQKQRQQQE
jgi:hypothetical protein